MSTPIGKKRFKVAKRVVEPSKFAVMRENEELRAKSVSMAQFMAALLMELPEDRLPLTYYIEDLETIHPLTVKIEFGDKTVTLSLTDPDQPLRSA
jgi:hypothetical protein